MGEFPPGKLNLEALVAPLTDTAIALTRYDTLLQTLPNSELLLAPLRARDAVISSRMEGTISTLEEVLRLEADAEDDELSAIARNDALEVAHYARALRQAEQQIAEGYKTSGHLIRIAHKTLSAMAAAQRAVRASSSPNRTTSETSEGGGSTSFRFRRNSLGLAWMRS